MGLIICILIQRINHLNIMTFETVEYLKMNLELIPFHLDSEEFVLFLFRNDIVVTSVCFKVFNLW